MRRRHPVLVFLAVAVLVAVSACSGETDAGDSNGADKVEVFSWWDGPGESEGYAALIAYFTKANGGVEFVNASVAGGAGTNARAVLASRLEAHDPPDSYQIHAGLELTSDIRAGRLEDLTYLYERNGWLDKFPRALLDAVTVDGKIYSVPVAIHRSNLLWYNPAALRAAGIAKPPGTWAEFLTGAAALKAKNLTPLSIGPGWTQKHLLENVLLGELGAERYTGLWNGRTDWRSAEVEAAVRTFARVLDVSDLKTYSGDWQSALDKVVAGTAAYTVMGDWADAYFGRAKGLRFEDDYDVVVSPGTSGVFNFLSDTFTLPRGAPHREAAESWLTACGSPEGQDAFSVQKRAIGARVDADKTKYNDYLATAMTAWQDPATVVVGSLTHGVVADTERSGKVDTALADFVDSGDVAAFISAVGAIFGER
jgi:glucose/mannose transport system substrate-binding protein